MGHTMTAVLVGVDSAGTADDAVEWAAAEAAARGLPLRIVHALRPSQAVGLDAFDVSAEHLLARRRAAEEVLRRAVARARSIVSDLDIETAILQGPANWALEHASHGAPLLVLGSRGRTALRRLTFGSVSGHLAACSRCPAVVVRHQDHPVAAGPAVVAGVVRGPRGLAAVEFAFRAAWQRGIPLTLVHVAPANATLDALAGVPPCHIPTEGLDEIPDPAIVSAVVGWRREFPDTEVRLKDAVGDPATILLAESSGAALLVLGSAGGKRRGARQLTSVGQRVLPKARCPVAIVGHDAARTSAHPRSHAFGGPEAVRPPGPKRTNS